MKKLVLMLVFLIMATTIVTANSTLTVTKIGEGIVMPDVGLHEYDDGEEITITAIPLIGWEFVEWIGNVSDNDDSITTITMDQNQLVEAVFVESDNETTEGHTLTMNIQGEGIIMPNQGDYELENGTNITITAIPAIGWEFVEWIGNVSDNDDLTTTITLNQNQLVEAVFVESNDENETGLNYTLTIITQGEGTTTPGVGVHEYEAGREVTLIAVSAIGWSFDRWEGNVDDDANFATSITINNNETVEAIFINDENETGIDYTLTIITQGEGTTTPGVGVHDYEVGREVTVVAIPSVGWSFDRWVGNVEDNNQGTTTITMNDDETIEAVFTEGVGVGNFWLILLLIIIVVGIIIAIFFNSGKRDRNRKRD